MNDKTKMILRNDPAKQRGQGQDQDEWDDIISTEFFRTSIRVIYTLLLEEAPSREIAIKIMVDILNEY